MADQQVITLTLPNVASSAGMHLQGAYIIDGVRGEVSTSSGHYVLVSPETGIFGSGFDLASAIHDFRAALHQHHDTLNAVSVDSLSRDLRRQLDFLNARLVKAS
jgi:hypothetical protein